MRTDRRISTEPDAPARVFFVAYPDEEESFKSRGEQAVTEIVQTLLDSQMLESALTAALGAREKALEAQKAAMAALNLPSAEEIERLERRLRSISQRLDDVEDLLGPAGGGRRGDQEGGCGRHPQAASRQGQSGLLNLRVTLKLRVRVPSRKRGRRVSRLPRGSCRPGPRPAPLRRRSGPRPR